MYLGTALNLYTDKRIACVNLSLMYVSCAAPRGAAARAGAPGRGSLGLCRKCRVPTLVVVTLL